MKKISLVTPLVVLSLLSLQSSTFADKQNTAVEAQKQHKNSASSVLNKQQRLQFGKEMYQQVCFDCHDSGFNGAPRIGNMDDWKERRLFGKEAILESVLKGKGLMPRQGGSAEDSKARYALMVEYMLSTVNADNIRTTPEMHRKAEIARHLSNGKSLYEMVCADCHDTGANGAPKMTDKVAWEPRVNKGFNKLVSNVINGHGNMIPLGGSAIQSVEGVREMVIYMLTTAGFKPKTRE